MDAFTNRTTATAFPGIACGLVVALLGVGAPASAAPTVYPVGLTISEPDRIWPGYVIYTASQAKKVVMLDKDGVEVHEWKNPYNPEWAIAENPKPLKNGHLLVQVRKEDGPNGEKRKGIAELDWNGKVVWEFFDPDFSYIHHDFDRKPNGHTIVLGSRYITRQEIAPYAIKDDILIEVDETGQTVWQWSTANHFDQLGLSDEGKADIYNDSYPSRNTAADIFHTNSVQSLPTNPLEASDPRFAKGNILVSQRTTNKVFVIDRKTKDIVWLIDRRDRFKNGQMPIGQHHVTMIPERDISGKKLPGWGRILLFDNGGHGGYPRRYRFASRVLEVDPLDNEIDWLYDATMSQQFVRDFFSMFKSSAQRLPNNNTLISESSSGRIFEVTSKGKIVWEYINPYFKAKNKSPRPGGMQNHIYRAYKVGEEWRDKARRAAQ
jgi:hypothetical protein